MPNPIQVSYDLDLSAQPPNTAISLVIREAGAARLATGIELFQGATRIDRIDAWPDYQSTHIVFMLRTVNELRRKNLDVFGRAFPGQPDNAKVWCEFYAGHTLIESSKPAEMVFDDNTASIDFSINTLFV